MMTGGDEILKDHFSKYLDDDIRLSFFPCFLGEERCNARKPPSYNLDPEQYTFHFILGGTGYMDNNGKVTRLSANDVFYIPANKGGNGGICYYPDKEDPWHYIWFNFMGEGAERLAECAKLTITDNTYSVQNPAVLRQQLADMIAVARNTAKRNASYYLPYMMKFFAEIADERRLRTRAVTDKEKKVQEIVNIIESTCLAPDFSVKAIADSMFYTTSYISRIFKEVTGMTTVEYVRNLRMLKATDMLRSKMYSITQIAYAVGYNSPFYFSKEFKKHFGYPPSLYEDN